MLPLRSSALGFISWGAAFNSFSATVKLVPLLLQSPLMGPFRRIKCRRACWNKSVSMECATSIWVARPARLVNRAPYLLTYFLPSLTCHGPNSLPHSMRTVARSQHASWGDWPFSVVRRYDTPWDEVSHCCLSIDDLVTIWTNLTQSDASSAMLSILMGVTDDQICDMASLYAHLQPRLEIVSRSSLLYGRHLFARAWGLPPVLVPGLWPW